MSHEADVPGRDEEPDLHGEWDDETAAWYVEHYGDHPTVRMTVEAAGLRARDVVVDVGCGGGEAARRAADYATRGAVIGVDPAPAMIRIASEQTRSHPGAARIRFLEGAAEQLPLEAGSANVVLAINSLHHWPEPEVALREVLRVLAPGGRFWIGDEETEDGTWGHGECALSDARKLQHAVEAAGFCDVQTRRLPSTDTVLLLLSARKPGA